MSPFLSFLLQMMKHAWDGYAAYAWGKNELRPVTKRGHSASIFGSAAMGASIIDGMVRSTGVPSGLKFTGIPDSTLRVLRL